SFSALTFAENTSRAASAIIPVRHIRIKTLKAETGLNIIPPFFRTSDRVGAVAISGSRLF
ncbi:hypothetical protein OFM36_26765, partial [Escherichia coli]|nr:hypothetical protein [Escherichia coli]